MVKYVDPFKFECQICKELLSVEELDTHLENGAAQAITDYIVKHSCPFCHKYFDENELLQGICTECDLGAGPKISEDLSPIAEILNRNVRFTYISNQGIANIENYLDKWLSNFESSDRGVLTWMFFSSLMPNFGGPHDPNFWHTPEFLDLDIDRKNAMLPKDSSCELMLKVWNLWYQEWRQTILDKGPISFDDSPPTDIEISKALDSNQRYLDAVETVWGLESGNLPSLSSLANTLGTTLERIRLTIARSGNDIRFGGSVIRDLNQRRDNLLWVAKFIDSFKLKRNHEIPFQKLIETTTNYLDSIPAAHAQAILSFTHFEMTLEEISTETGFTQRKIEEILKDFLVDFNQNNK